jgi:AraC family transcriptional regulator of adaptative response/methylated-DNA-[protein]-cysteine methyltransferase
MSAPALSFPANHADRALPYHARIAQAIGYVAEHYQDQPSLEEMAGAASLSPFHFQRVFKRWAGISPKRFLQYVTLAHAKRLLVDDASVLDAALDAGLSGPSRLHDLFVTCEAMTPGAQSNTLCFPRSVFHSLLLIWRMERSYCTISSSL